MLNKFIQSSSSTAIICLIILGSSSRVFSQADAGPDKLIFVNSEGTHIGKENADQSYCYTWIDESTNNIVSHESYPEVKPAKTTTYKLIAVGENFSSKNEDEVIVNVAKLKLKKATFGGGNHKLKTDDGTWAGEGTGDVRVPEIVDGQTSSEICYTWDSSPTMNVEISIEPSVSGSFSGKLELENSEYGFKFEKDVTLTGSTLTTTIGTSSKFPKKMDNNTFSINWTCSVENGDITTDFLDTENPIYIVAGTPSGGGPTIKRIGDLTAVAAGLGNKTEILKKLWKDVVDNDNFDLNIGISSHPTLWEILDKTSRGDCNCLSNLFLKVLAMIGISGSGQIMYCYPGFNKTPFEDPSANKMPVRLATAGNNGHTNNSHANYYTSEVFGYIDFGGGHNNWEATFKYNDNGTYIYFAPGTDGSSYSSLMEVMTSVVKQTAWFYFEPNPADPTKTISIVCQIERTW